MEKKPEPIFTLTNWEQVILALVIYAVTIVLTGVSWLNFMVTFVAISLYMGGFITYTKFYEDHLVIVKPLWLCYHTYVDYSEIVSVKLGEGSAYPGIPAVLQVRVVGKKTPKIIGEPSSKQKLELAEFLESKGIEYDFGD